MVDEVRYGPIISGSDGVAEERELRQRRISSNTGLSARRALWIDESVAASGISVPSNIAEGQAHYSAREFHRFLSHARGSLVEIETQIMIALDLAYLRAEEAERLLLKAAELGRILNGLIASTKSDTRPLQIKG
jgi:four helix bundle protein